MVPGFKNKDMKDYKFIIVNEKREEVNIIMKENMIKEQARDYQSLLLDSVPDNCNVKIVEL